MSASANMVLKTDVARPVPEEIVISRWYPATQALLFRLWTDPVHIAKWWGPEGFRQTLCRVELREGGEFALDLLGPDGVTYPCRGRYRRIEPPHLLVLDGLTEPGLAEHPCGSGLPPRASVEVHFEKSGSGTLITIRSILASAADAEAAIQHGFGVGWTMSLETIARLVEAEAFNPSE